jgi:hypothetical protein
MSSASELLQYVLYITKGYELNIISFVLEILVLKVLAYYGPHKNHFCLLCL